MKRNRLFSALSLAGACGYGLHERKNDPADGGGNGGGNDAVKEIKGLIEGIGRKFEEYKRTNDERIAKLAKGEAVGDLETKLAKIETDLAADTERKAALDKHLADLEKSLLQGGNSEKAKADNARELKMFNAMRKTGPNPGNIRDFTADEYGAYKEAAAIYLRKGSADSMTDVQRKAMLAGDDPNGGFFLPAPDVGRIVERVFELSPIRSIVDVQAISSNALEGINDNDEAAAGWVGGETDARPDTNTPKVGKYRIEAHEMYAQPKATQTLLDDSAVDVEGWLARKVAAKFARLEGAAFVNGNGVNQPRGFTTYPMATTDDDSRPWGTIQYVKTGTNGSFGTNADVLFDLIAAFRQPYLQNAKFVTRREVLAALRKLKGSVNADYLWQPGLQQGQPDKLLGYPITVAQDLPALATNGFSMWFGDWTEFYTIVDRVGIRVLRDPFTDKPYIKFYTTKRVGGGVLNYESVKAVQFSA